MKEIEISLRVNRMLYEGKALYDEETDYVNLSAIKKNGEEIQPDFSLGAFYCGYRIGTVAEILSYEVRRKVHPEKYGTCYESGYYFPMEDLIYCDDKDADIYKDLCVYSDVMGTYLCIISARHEQIRFRNGDLANDYVTEDWLSDHYWCEHCNAYIENNDDYAGNDTCQWCYDEDECVIEGYTQSHDHNRHPVFFGGSDKEKYLDSFSGMGFELEVDSKDDDFTESYNNETARNICSEAGLEDNEMRYAHDGSLNYGFECISQPHTVEDFWAKTKKWEKMLQYLLSRGYRSHDPGTCGLHVHVSRNMFGKTQTTQDSAIAKVYTFYDENWDDLAKVSRRRDFGYCDRNVLSPTQKINSEKTGKYKQWKERSKMSASKGHYVALNNNGTYTFEYRLARGTLNAWSFFSWIDLTLTITRNARRITIKQVDTNDKVSWLSGISESTARYIYQRGAFKDTVLALYPSIAWSQDNRDTNDSDDDE